MGLVTIIVVILLVILLVTIIVIVITVIRVIIVIDDSSNNRNAQLHAKKNGSCQVAPYFCGTCEPVACPDLSAGPDVPTGCSCKDGVGSVTPSSQAPFYAAT